MSEEETSFENRENCRLPEQDRDDGQEDGEDALIWFCSRHADENVGEVRCPPLFYF